ncbi:MAG: transcription termination factor NusA [Coriobacteriales bacterium]|nr:transcription termination factor NusA [Coriobacteriales bacterium]
MSSELMAALEALAAEKNIDEIYLLERLEQSLAKSYENILKLEWDARVTINRETGNIYVYEMVPVGEPDEETGEYAEFEERDVTPRDVSRIAAQNAKNVILSIVRDAGRQAIFTEYSDRKGELVTGTVLQSTPDFTIIKIRDGVEAELPHFDVKRHAGERNEKPANEHYRHNQRLKSLIIEVRDPNVLESGARSENTRPSIVVSRTHPDLIRRLFEIEVPEIYDGVVEIKSIAREAGARSKVAVSSRESNLDPVGACVGPKGSRVRMVVEELRNERVDVIQYDENPSVYVANALSPAKVNNVIVNEGTQYATVIVPDDQLSLAIGKEGQNARLAARLTGWHIDIKSSSLMSELPSVVTTLFDDEDQAVENEGGRCEYVSPDGIRCRNHALPHSRFCRLHEGAASGEASDGAAGAGADVTETDAAKAGAAEAAPTSPDASPTAVAPRKKRRTKAERDAAAEAQGDDASTGDKD